MHDVQPNTCLEYRGQENKVDLLTEHCFEIKQILLSLYKYDKN